MSHSHSEWEVALAISGPIAIKTPLNFPVEKGQDQPFWTTVDLKPATHGILTKVVARASTSEEANDVAVFFIGQMLDYLCLRLRDPLYVSLQGLQFRQSSNNVKRLVERKEWIEAFRLGRDYGLKQPAFSRALSWYRKGLVSEDPMDQLIAYWSSLESIGAKLARRNERTERGAINQICDCFDQIWGNVAEWKVIPNQAELINEIHHLRSGVAHGFIAVYPDKVREIASLLPTLSDLAYNFLSDWERKFPDGEEISTNDSEEITPQ